MNLPLEKFEIKGSLKSVIGKLFLFIFGFLSIFVLLIILLIKPNLSFEFGKVLLLIGILFIAFVIWIKSYKITLNDNKLSYKSIFQSEALIKIDEIKRVKYQGYANSLDHYEEKSKLYPKVFLYPLARGKEGLIEITLDVFNNNDLQKFYDLLESIDKLPFKRNVRKK